MDGVVRWPNDLTAVAVFEVRDNDAIDTVYSPTLADLEEICDRHELDFRIISEVIQEHPESHTFIIDAEIFRTAHGK